jgi:hypothetical protein
MEQHKKEMVIALVGTGVAVVSLILFLRRGGGGSTVISSNGAAPASASGLSVPPLDLSGGGILDMGGGGSGGAGGGTVADPGTGVQSSGNGGIAKSQSQQELEYWTALATPAVILSGSSGTTADTGPGRVPIATADTGGDPFPVETSTNATVFNSVVPGQPSQPVPTDYSAPLSSVAAGDLASLPPRLGGGQRTDTGGVVMVGATQVTGAPPITDYPGTYSDPTGTSIPVVDPEGPIHAAAAGSSYSSPIVYSPDPTATHMPTVAPEGTIHAGIVTSPVTVTGQDVTTTPVSQGYIPYQSGGYDATTGTTPVAIAPPLSARQLPTPPPTVRDIGLPHGISVTTSVAAPQGNASVRVSGIGPTPAGGAS